MTTVTQPRRTALIGAGRLGNALARRLRHVGHQVIGPLPRGYASGELARAHTILLCVPDREIAAAAAVLADHLANLSQPANLVGHCSGASPLDVLAPLPPAACFSLHPLMTFSGAGDPHWDGAAAAVSGSGPATLEAAMSLARELGLSPFAIAEEDRPAYHAAASMASNFLITLELAAETLAATAGCERAALVPLVRTTVENWAREGSAALTGPIARGDAVTVASQRAAVDERTPQLLALFDTLADATRGLAAQPVAA